MQNRRVFAARAALIFTAPVVLSACGFALKGSADLPFQRLFLDASQHGPVVTALRLQLRAVQGLQLLDHPAQSTQAQITLQVLRDEQKRREAAADVYALSHDMQLFTQFDYQILNAAGDPMGEVVNLQQRRDLSYTDAVSLSKSDEEQLLFNDMANDIAQQVMRRLAALHL